MDLHHHDRGRGGRRARLGLLLHGHHGLLLCHGRGLRGRRGLFLHGLYAFLVRSLPTTVHPDVRCVPGLVRYVSAQDTTCDFGLANDYCCLHAPRAALD